MKGQVRRARRNKVNGGDSGQSPRLDPPQPPRVVVVVLANEPKYNYYRYTGRAVFPHGRRGWRKNNIIVFLSLTTTIMERRCEQILILAKRVEVPYFAHKFLCYAIVFTRIRNGFYLGTSRPAIVMKY